MTRWPTTYGRERPRAAWSPGPWSDKVFDMTSQGSMPLVHNVVRKRDVGVRWCYLGEKRRIERGLGISGLDVPSLLDI